MVDHDFARQRAITTYKEVETSIKIILRALRVTLCYFVVNFTTKESQSAPRNTKENP